MEKILHIKQNSSSMFEVFYKKIYKKHIHAHTCDHLGDDFNLWRGQCISLNLMLDTNASC